jgi:Arc/MetJ-type ribon-helix-helix transcriptional regulator
MTRTTVSLPDELLNRIRQIALDRRTSMAELVRQALEELAARERPKPKSFGAGASKYTDTARTVANEPQPPVSWR